MSTNQMRVFPPNRGDPIDREYREPEQDNSCNRHLQSPSSGGGHMGVSIIYGISIIGFSILCFSGIGKYYFENGRRIVHHAQIVLV